MKHHLTFLKNLVSNGGPDVHDYYELDAWIAELAEQVKFGKVSQDNLASLRDILGDSFSKATMQGFAFQKPHGYAGDYEIIDRIYRRYVSDHVHLSKWDVYWQEHAAAHAVRNRVGYFNQTAGNVIALFGKGEILNLASGPGRDMLLFYEQNPGTSVRIDCIEQDQNAINHASELCRDHLHKITFHVKNALRFQTKTKYHLVWSAGLFDYFDDKVFIFMLKKLGTMVEDGGEIVIGNFSTVNPSRPYMELFEWHLHHRSPNTLRALALEAGFAASRIRIEKEATAVNLFLHIQAD